MRRGAIIASVLLLVSAAAPAADEDTRANAEQLERVRARIDALQQTLEHDRTQQDQLRSQLEDSEKRWQELSFQVADLRKQIAEQTTLRHRTENQLREAQAQLDRHRDALARQVRAAYVIGQRGQTQIVLNQDKSQRLARVITYYDYLNRARVARIEKILDQRKALEQLAAKLRQQTAELEATRSRQQGTLTALDAVRAEREDMMGRLHTRIEGEQEQLRRLKEDERELSSLLKEIHAALRDVPANLGSQPFAKLKGKLPWPSGGHRLLARFGDPKAGGRMRWNGLWIAGSEGDAVKAVARGRVAYVGWMHAYGLIVVLEHEGGYYSLYGHNQGVTVSMGDWVQSGDVISSVGATGGHDRNGVYFELRKGTDPVNPRPWFKAKG